MNDLPECGKDLLYLVYCSLHECKPKAEKLAAMDLEKLFRYAKYHTLDSITYMALEGVESLPELEVLGVWKERRLKALRKNMMLDAEREKLFAYLDERQIWYMPLKGSVLKALYPRQDMRQMADNDILFDAAYQKDVRDYFVSRGYEVDTYNKGNHDVYKKAPIYNFEMHTSLFGASHDALWVSYYERVKERLLPNGTGAGYHFTDEDFYVYFVTHAYKHFDGSGTGIRSLVDSYVYQSVKTLDWAYIEAEAEKLGIGEFEKRFRRASRELFATEDGLASLSGDDFQLVYECMSAGTYGNQKNRVEKSLQKLQKDGEPITGRTKWKYLMWRIIPPMEFYKVHYPTIYKLKFPIPFFVVYRIFRGAFTSGKRLLNEALLVLKTNK